MESQRPNAKTRRVMVGAVPVGKGAPCAVQSMLNAAADDVTANLAQIERLAEAGCEIVRMAIRANHASIRSKPYARHHRFPWSPTFISMPI